MVRAYSRREYIRKIPNNRIVQYDMGNLSEDFPVRVSLAVKKPAQIRHNALEAARVASNRYMQRSAGRLGYHLKLRQSGMRNAFGKAISVEALVKTNQKIMSIDVNPKNFEDAKTALKRAGMKMPVSCRIVIEKGADLIK